MCLPVSVNTLSKLESLMLGVMGAKKRRNKMPDISMCKNEECKNKNVCFRYMAEPNEYRQAYMEYKHDKNGDCGDYLSISEYGSYAIRKEKK